jgi:dihydrolipoamide dehydrogenase
VAHDLVVVGGGPGGYATAFRAATRGLDVAMVEADRVGGTCLHRGCIPSKALLHVAEVLEELHRRHDLGIDADVRGVHLDGLRDFRDRVVRTMHRGLQGLVKQRDVAYHEGIGRILEPGVVEVRDTDGGTERVEARETVIATGSVPRGLPDVEIDGRVVMTSDDALRVDRVPARVVVVGAGAVGMEFATFWRALGADVTIVEALDRALPMEDADSSRAIEKAMRRAGIDLVTSATVEKATVSAGDEPHATVTVSGDEGSQELEVDTVLIAIGRRPNLDAVGAADLGVVDERGFVTADEHGRTGTEHVWAVGDVLPTLALAHAAFAEGFVVADAVAGEETRPVDHAQVPRVTYCRPEVASVGLTEEEARERADDVETTTYPLRANAKGIISGLDGHVKTVHRGADGETLGVHIVAAHATDLIAEASLATYWGAYPSEVAEVIHAHPTLSEAIGESFLAAAGTPSHTHCRDRPWAGRDVGAILGQPRPSGRVSG